MRWELVFCTCVLVFLSACSPPGEESSLQPAGMPCGPSTCHSEQLCFVGPGGDPECHDSAEEACAMFCGEDECEFAESAPVWVKCIENPLSCEEDSDCAVQPRSCDNCICPAPVNRESLKAIACTSVDTVCNLDCALTPKCVKGSCTLVKTVSASDLYPEVGEALKERDWVDVVVRLKHNKLTDPFEEKDAEVRKTEIARLQELVLDQLSKDEFFLTKRSAYSNDFYGRVSMKGLAKLSIIAEVGDVELDTENPIKSIA